MKKIQKHTDEDRSGVYQISTPTINDCIYIGSAIRFKRRWIVHRSDLERGKHHSPRLQAIFQKHGFSTLEFQILEFCEPSACIETEQRHIDFYPRKRLYNTNPIAGSRLGAKLTEYQKRLLTEKKGGISSPELLQQIIREYEDGALQIELAKKFNVDRASIRNYLKRNGAELRPLPTRNAKLKEIVASKYLSGCSIKRLACEHKLDYDTIVRILQIAGVDLRSNSQRQKLRFQSTEARKASAKAKGGRTYCFVHRVHGKFIGYPFELAEKFDLKSRGNIGQLVRGKRAVYSGWEIADASGAHQWKRPEKREFLRGIHHHRFGRHHSQTTRSLMSATRRRLSPQQIAEARTLLSQGFNQGDLALKFGVHQSVISRIKTKKRGYANL